MEEIDQLLTELSKQKVIHNQSKDEIQKLEQRIAELQCPFKIGDTVKIVRGDKESCGIIGHIHAAYDNPVHYMFPDENKNPGWSIGGKKINKTTGLVGQHGFGADSIYFDVNIEAKTLTAHNNPLDTLISSN